MKIVAITSINVWNVFFRKDDRKGLDSFLK